MPFNNNKNGYKNEDDFVKLLNRKQFKNLNFNLQHIPSNADNVEFLIIKKLT